jgi:hypothetical protein
MNLDKNRSVQLSSQQYHRPMQGTEIWMRVVRLLEPSSYIADNLSRISAMLENFANEP